MQRLEPGSTWKSGSPTLTSFLWVFVVLTAVYVPTSSLTLPNSIDPQTNALTAYLLAETGSPIARGYEAGMPTEGRDRSLWIEPSPSGPVSRYPPGTAYIAAPAYWLADVSLVAVEIHPMGPGTTEILLLPEMWPAAIVASVTTAAAMAVLALLLLELGLSPRSAVGSALVFGLGTAMWSVAANALWQHGPAALFIMLGLLLVARERFVLAGMAFAGGVLVRPQIAIVVAFVGVALAISARSVRPMVKLGATASLGAIGFAAYNYVIFDEFLPALAGGYALTPENFTIGSRPLALWQTFFDIDRGLFIHSPFLIVAVFAAFVSWRSADTWVVAAALGGLLYIVFQARAGDFSGGWGFWSYRYPLEGLTFAAPLMAVAAREWLHDRRVLSLAAGIAIAASIALHGFGTIVIEL